VWSPNGLVTKTVLSLQTFDIFYICIGEGIATHWLQIWSVMIKLFLLTDCKSEWQQCIEATGNRCNSFELHFPNYLFTYLFAKNHSISSRVRSRVCDTSRYEHQRLSVCKERFPVLSVSDIVVRLMAFVLRLYCERRSFEN